VHKEHPIHSSPCYIILEMDADCSTEDYKHSLPKHLSLLLTNWQANHYITLNRYM